MVICAATVCAVAALIVRHRMKSSGKWAKAMAILKEFEEKFATPIGKLRQVADAMTVEMHAGLASQGGSKLKMLISYVDNLPTFPITHVQYPLQHEHLQYASLSHRHQPSNLTFFNIFNTSHHIIIQIQSRFNQKHKYHKSISNHEI
ncbi:hexokinase [Ranunculus cassubicifolius]